MSRYWKVLLSLALAFWLGGLTFYALIVVPLGTLEFGSVEQGLLTRSVTIRLNWVGSAVLGALLADAAIMRRRSPAALWGVMAASQVGLWILHARLQSLLDLGERLVLDDAQFYFHHRLYLLVTALQWLAGIVYFCLVVIRQRIGAGQSP